jgi:hypothetical protein
MSTTMITDVNDRELGVFIPIQYWEEIKKLIPGISQSIIDRSLADLVSSLSLFTLHELSQSILSGLKAYYGRNIILEEEQANPEVGKISIWEDQMNEISALQRDNTNFDTRQRMEEIIINYAPLLSRTV